MGRRPMKDVLENHLKDLLFHLVHWLSITLSLRRISQESINLERKSYLDCSSDTLSTQEEFGRVTHWLQTLRSWKRWTHQKSIQKRLNAKEVMFPKEKGEFIFSIADGRIKFDGGEQDLRTSTLVRHHPTRGDDQRDFLREWEGSPPPLPQDSLPFFGDHRTKWFLVHFMKLHIPPSRWTQSQTLLAERRIIPYSTKVHWRIQNYSYEFGCQAREAHRWLLEYWWLSKLVWSLDRFHTIYSIGRKTSKRIYVVREEINKKTAYIQARSSMARTLEINGKARQAEGEAKVVRRKVPSWKRSKIARDLFHRPWGYGTQRNH